MLRRIAEIKNVGTFTNCVARQIGFEKITLIYGRNTYGKSTLGDIFYSLEKNDEDAITARKSIPVPDEGGAQSLKLQFARDDENENQGISHFRGGSWVQGLRASHKLKTFNDAFYHNHVFASRRFSRETKVNFSQFILGAQGVALANQIKELKSEKRNHTARKTALLRDVFADVGNVEAFLASPLIDNPDQKRAQKDALEAEKYELVKQRGGLGIIRNRPELIALTDDYSLLIQFFDEINGIFSTTLDTLHEQAKTQLEAHVDKNFAQPRGGEHWIQQGLKYGKDENCQFCGQALSGDALALLGSYRQYFDDEFDRHDAFVKQELDRLGAGIETNVFIEMANKVKLNWQYWERYPDIDAFEAVKQELGPLSQTIDELLNSANRELITIRTAFFERAQNKKAKPHYEVEGLIVEGIGRLIADLDESVDAYNTIAERINLHIEQFKEHLDDDHINQRISEIDAEILSVQTLLQRFEKNEACVELTGLNVSIAQNEVQIPTLEEQLNNEQSEYLDRYFGSINHYFNELGSRNFLLERRADRGGNTPVYHLKVKFHGQDIPESDLDKIFSESDRRALGLSIFLAALDAMDVAELHQTVVVFDDPVTSFDDHRVSNTHRSMVNLSERCEQIILLSHYREGLSQFLKTYGFGNNYRVKLIEIRKNHQTSSFVDGDASQFTRTAHEENREKILDFIERRVDTVACSLRLFLEAEIGLRFGKQLTEHQIPNDTLNNRINAMVDNNIVTAAVGQDLHRWREDLNPEHHTWLGDDIDNKRNTASRFIDFVYHSLVPA